MLLLDEPRNALVRERWARVERLGLERDSDGYPIATTDADLTERREQLADAFRGDKALLELVVSKLATGPRVAIIADRDGVILSARGDRRLVDPVTRVRLVEGAHWGEATRGTNAIGTAVAEGRAVAVVGDAHFEVRNRELFCYATPIRDAYGDIVAVLDVSGPMSAHDPALGLAVEAAGEALERATRGLSYQAHREGTLPAIERLIARSRDPVLLVESSGRVRLMNASARVALRIDESERLTCERVFGVPFDVLVTSSASQSGMRLETRHGTWRLSLDPIFGARDRTLAMLVHFETASPTPISTPEPSPRSHFDRIWSDDPEVDDAKKRAETFASTMLPVLLLAETGTGKELFARAIHDASPRSEKPFVAVNCGALSPTLIASELFGYAPFAFTGAARGGAEGRIAAAHGGTLFLDEIAEMPEALQAALLRVLDDGVYQRVGESRERRADFRLVCATCRDLPALVDSGKFRNDLFYRIQGACVSIPALRDRVDTEWLAKRFLGELAPHPVSFSAEAIDMIVDHTWPGNVRELKSAVVHAIALAGTASTITREHLPPMRTARRAIASSEARTRTEILTEAIDGALRACGGNVSEAARRLGVGRGTIYRAVQKRGK